jgi:uncharacterized cupredoxin-like copper-binding protein
MKWSWVIATVTIAMAAPALAETGWSQAQTVTVVTTDYHFSPEKLVFKRGTAYRLHLENRGKELHEFSAPAFFKTADIRDPTVLNADRTEIAVHPGEVKDLYFVPQRAGRFPLICPDHDWTGMAGEITVE